MRAFDTLAPQPAGPEPPDDAARGPLIASVTRLASVQGAARALMLLGIVGIATLLPVWLRMIVSPAPQEMREGALLWTTIAFLHGHNPYALDTLPGPANVYGPLYPLLVTPLAWLFGPTLFVHRLVNNLAILVACTLLYRVLRREGASNLTALTGAAINFAGLLYWVGPTTRPDGLGVALLVGAYTVMVPDPTSARRLAGGLALSLLGFATKIYYVLPALTVVAWLLWRTGLRRGLRAGVITAAALLVATTGLAWLFPAWAPIVLGANIDATTYDVHYLLRQTLDWMIFSLPLVVALLGGLLAAMPLSDRREWLAGVDLWTVALAAGLAAVLFKMGGHRGAHMTYFFHLVTPPLTVVALRRLDRSPWAQLAVGLAFVAALGLNAHWFMRDPGRLARAERTFATLASEIDHAAHPTGTGEFAPLLLAAGVDPTESGHTQYFHIVAPPWYLGPFWSSLSTLYAQERQFTQQFYKTLDGRGYDVIVANRRALDLLSPPLLYSRYRDTQHLDIDLPWARQSWPVDVWVPD